MEKKEVVKYPTEIVTDIICDCCGKSCKTMEGVIDNDARIDIGEKYYDFEYMTLESHWGYHSEKDGQKWEAQICEKCVDEHLYKIIKFNKERY